MGLSVSVWLFTQSCLLTRQIVDEKKLAKIRHDIHSGAISSRIDPIIYIVMKLELIKRHLIQRWLFELVAKS